MRYGNAGPLHGMLLLGKDMFMPFGLPNISYVGYPVSLPCAGHAGLGLREARPSDEPAVLAHYRNLAPTDRRNRFCGTLDDTGVATHVAGLWRRETLLIAAHDGPLWPGPFHNAGPIRAIAELALGLGTAELGITVEDGLRRHGIGTWLVQLAGYLLLPRGIARLTAYTLPDNSAFLTLSRRAGAEIDRAPDQIEVTFDLHALRRSYLRRRAAEVWRRAG